MYMENHWFGPIPSFIPPKDREENHQQRKLKT